MPSTSFEHVVSLFFPPSHPLASLYWIKVYGQRAGLLCLQTEMFRGLLDFENTIMNCMNFVTVLFLILLRLREWL